MKKKQAKIGKKKRVVLIRIPEDLAKELDRQAHRLQVSKNKACIWALHHYLAVLQGRLKD